MVVQSGMVDAMTEALNRLMESLVWFCTGYVAATIVTGRSLNPARRKRNHRNG